MDAMRGLLVSALMVLAGCSGAADVVVAVHEATEGATSMAYGSITAKCDAGFTMVALSVTNRQEMPLSIRSDHWRISFEGASREPMRVEADSQEVAPDGRLAATLAVCGPQDAKATEVLLYSKDPLEDDMARLLARARVA